jgi:hypothetical protein
MDSKNIKCREKDKSLNLKGVKQEEIDAHDTITVSHNKETTLNDSNISLHDIINEDLGGNGHIFDKHSDEAHTYD